MTSPALVSIVVPAYNAERFLGEALRSIRAQTHAALEIVVCDDASTDGTALVAQGTGDPRVRYLRNDRTLGGYGAMNRAVRASSGDYVAIYHADDIYDARIVERELAFLQSHQDVVAAFCLDRFVDESGDEYGRLRVPRSLEGVDVIDMRTLANALLRHKNTFLRTPSLMMRRRAFDAVDGFDQAGFGIAADLDMWLRLSLHGPIGLVHEHLFGYRHYSAQWSKRYERLRVQPEMYFAVMDRHLARPEVRAVVEPSALAQYALWRTQDQVECAANAFILGDRRAAGSLPMTAPLAALLRAPRTEQLARVLALRILVRAAALSDSRTARSVVHFARFRRPLPSKLDAPPPSVTQSLGDSR